MLAVQHISKNYDRQPVLREISLEVREQEILCLLGPSGCGKTTLLRLIAGLETPDNGSITLDSKNIMNTPPHHRGFGLMFQDFALFPHMIVRENVAFGLQMQKLGRDEIHQRVNETLEIVGLSDFAERSVTELSGG